MDQPVHALDAHAIVVHDVAHVTMDGFTVYNGRLLERVVQLQVCVAAAVCSVPVALFLFPFHG